MRRGAGHAAGCGRGSLCALCPPRPFGCVPGQLRTSPNRPAHALRSASIAGGEIELALLCAEGQGMLPTPGRACRERCARRAARVPSWTEPCPCVSLCRRVVDLHERVRTSTLAPTLTPAPTLTLPPLNTLTDPNPNPYPNPNRRLPCGDHLTLTLTLTQTLTTALNPNPNPNPDPDHRAQP